MSDYWDQWGGRDAYASSQQDRYTDACNSGDADLQERLVNDAVRVGYDLSAPEHNTGTSSHNSNDTVTFTPAHSHHHHSQKPAPPVFTPPTIPPPFTLQSPETQEQVKVTKYEYLYGLQDMTVKLKRHTDRSIYVSKPIMVDGNVMQVSLLTEEEHPLPKDTLHRGTSIEYYITYTDTPAINDWYPILPEGETAIINEFLFLNGCKAILRFPLDFAHPISIYGNGYLLDNDQWVIGSSLQEIQINSPVPGTIYTIDYTPNTNIVTPYLIDFQKKGAIPVSVEEIFRGGTNRNAMVALSNYPYINYANINSVSNYDPNDPTGYRPILVSIKNADIVGEYGQVLTDVYPYSSNRTIYTKNMTDYKTKKIVQLTPYDPTTSDTGIINPAIQYYQKGKFLVFTETFKNAEVVENMATNHGNGDIIVFYEKLITQVRFKAILRCTLPTPSISPILHGYTLKFRTMK